MKGRNLAIFRPNYASGPLLGVLAPKKLHVSPTKLVTNDEVFVVKHAGKIAKYLFLGAKTPRILGAKTPNKGPDA